MKKILSLCFVITFILSCIGSKGLSNIINENEPEPIRNFNSIKEKIIFSDISLIEKGDYFEIYLNESNSKTILNNKYSVPSYIRIFKFPFGTKINNVKVMINDINHQKIRKKLFEMQHPFSINKINSSINNNYDDILKVNDKWFEYSIGAGIEGLNRYIFLKMNILPVKYDKNENIIEWINSAKIIIEYENLINEDSEDKTKNLLILAPKDFEDELNPLVEHKNNNMNFSTKLVTLDDIYEGTYFSIEGRDDQEKIKYFIKNSVENWGINYVLIVGGSKIFPVRVSQNEHPTKGGDLFACDLYYADIYNKDSDFCNWDTNNNNLFGEFKSGDSNPIDEVDLYPDVYLGRLSCINNIELKICVNKIIKYETEQFFKADWFSNIALIGGDTAIRTNEDPDNILEGEYTTDTIFQKLEGFNPIRLWVSNGELKSIFPTGNRKINEAIELGCGFSLFSGHGDVDVWGTHPKEINWMLPFLYGYRIYHINQLNNLDRLTIIISDACKNGNFDSTYKDTCWLWAFISNIDGGAVAGFGNTGTSHLYGGNYCIEGLSGHLHLKTMTSFNENISTIGEMWGYGINNYKFDTTNPSFLKHYDFRDIEMWHLLGDPSLRIKT